MIPLKNDHLPPQLLTVVVSIARVSWSQNRFFLACGKDDHLTEAFGIRLNRVTTRRGQIRIKGSVAVERKPQLAEERSLPAPRVVNDRDLFRVRRSGALTIEIQGSRAIQSTATEYDYRQSRARRQFPDRLVPGVGPFAGCPRPWCPRRVTNQPLRLSDATGVNVGLVVLFLAPFLITMVLPNSHGLALVPHTVFPVEPLEVRSDRADSNTEASGDLLIS